MPSSHNYFRPTVTEHFSGGHIPIPEPETPQQTQPPASPRLALDAALQVLGQVSIETELRDKLIFALRDVGQRANDLLERNHVARLQSLRDKHHDVVAQCRSKTDAINALLEDMNKMESSLRASAEKSGKARLLLTAAQRGAPAPEAYATEKEKENYAKGLEKLRAALEAAEQNEASTTGDPPALPGRQ